MIAYASTKCRKVSSSFYYQFSPRTPRDECETVMKRYVNTLWKELKVSAVFMHISGFRQISSQCKACYHCNWSIRWAHAKSNDSGLPPYSLLLNTSHRVFPENCDQANFCMDITLLIPNRYWWDYEGHFQIALAGYTLNIRMIDKEMTELWHLKNCRVSYSSVSCI